MVVRNGIGRYLYFPDTRICTESIFRLPFWKYSDCFDGRYYLDSRFGVVAGYPFFGFFLREIVYVAFDRDFALTQGVPVKCIEYVMMCCIAVTIVLSIRLVGIMLLMSLLTLPQITVNLFTSDFKKIIFGSIAIGFLGCVFGLVLSYLLNVPSGAFIILVLVPFLFDSESK